MVLFFEEEEFYAKRGRVIWMERSRSTSNSGDFSITPRVQAPADSKQAIVRIRHQSSKTNNGLLSYVADPKKAKDLVYDASGYKTQVKHLEKTVENWNRRNKTKRTARNGQTKKDRTATHFIFSTKEKPDKKSVAALVSSIQIVQAKHFTQKGFGSFFTIHKDTNHLHAHLVVHNRNLFTNTKIRFSRYSYLFSLRKDFAESLGFNGLNYSAALRPEKEKCKHQDYLTAKLVNHFGEEIKRFIKRQYVLANNSNLRGHETAKQNINLFRDYKNRRSLKEIGSRFESYRNSSQKYHKKLKLKERFKECHTIKPETIDRYVDVLYSLASRYEKSYHSKNEDSVKDLELVQSKIDDIMIISQQEIESFERFLKKKEQKKKQQSKAKEEEQHHSKEKKRKHRNNQKSVSKGLSM